MPRLPTSPPRIPCRSGRTGVVELDGEDVTAAIRDAEIDRLVPAVARHPEVREVMRERQRALAVGGDSVIEGRDIGTVVAPHAEVKVFLVADEDERARAADQRSSGRLGRGRSQPICAIATSAMPSTRSLPTTRSCSTRPS